MSEQEKNLRQGQNELTNQPNSHKLESEGEIFMADGTTNGPEQPPIEGPKPESEPVREAAGEITDSNSTTDNGATDTQDWSSKENMVRLNMEAMNFMATLTRFGIDINAGFDFISDEGQKRYFSSIAKQFSDAQEQTEKQARIAGKRLTESVEAITAQASAVAEAEDRDTVSAHAHDFVVEIEKIEHLLSDVEKEEMSVKDFKTYDKLKAALDDDSTSVEDLKEIVAFLSPKIKAHYSTKEGDKPPDMPLSLEDLVALISQRAEDEFKKGGEFALLEDVTENGIKYERVNLANFYEWVRHQTWRVHENNPTSEANFFTDEGMGVKTSFRTINFYEIVFTPSFFHERKTLLVDTGKKDKDGNMITDKVVQNIENEEYEALRQQIYKETFLFMLMRNGDWGYRDNMAGEKGMMQSLEAIYKNNPLTRGNFLETILSMPSMSRAALGEKKGGGRKIKEKAEVNFIMGDAIRRAWGSYMHIWDYEMVSKYLGEDSVFFKNQYPEFDEKGRPTGDKPKSSMAPDELFEPIDPDNPKAPRKLKSDSDSRAKFMEFMNLFLGPTPNQGKIKEIREKMVLSLMEKEGISYSEAKLAEAWAFSLSNFTGLSARNDTHSVGFQQWTKAQNLEDYRERQMAEERRAKYGSKYTLRGLKRIALSFMEAALTTDKRALYEVVQGGQGGVVDLENNPIKTYIDYERDFERDGAGYIVFKKSSGNIDIDLVRKIKEYKLSDKPNENGIYEVEFLDESGKPVDVGKSHPIKTEIVLRGADREVRAASYEIDKNGIVIFKDASGDVLNTEDLDAKKIFIKATQELEFDDQIQRQFIPNHMDMMNQWFRFVIDSEEMDFKGMFLGYNKTTGRPIIDQKKLKELKEGIRKNITYALSTWPGTDYTKTIRTWEKSGKNVVARDVSILQSMFGSEVLDFIDKETKSSRRKSILTDKNIDVYNLAKAQDSLNEEENKALKLAIWEGVFTYMVSKEIVAHRDWNSNLPRYGLEDAYAVYAVLHDGEVLYDDEASWVKDDSHTKLRWLFAESFGAAAAEGGAKGIFNIFKMMFKDIITS